VFESELVTVNTTEGAAYGAALLAGVGVGVSHWESVESACDAVVEVTGRTAPIQASSAAYAEVYRRYRELYPTLRTSFADLAALEAA
jgi:xylulokinase